MGWWVQEDRAERGGGQTAEEPGRDWAQRAHSARPLYLGGGHSAHALQVLTPLLESRLHPISTGRVEPSRLPVTGRNVGQGWGRVGAHRVCHSVWCVCVCVCGGCVCVCVVGVCVCVWGVCVRCVCGGVCMCVSLCVCVRCVCVGVYVSVCVCGVCLCLCVGVCVCECVHTRLCVWVSASMATCVSAAVCTGLSCVRKQACLGVVAREGVPAGRPGRGGLPVRVGVGSLGQAGNRPTE